jgi:hypothetical protein
VLVAVDEVALITLVLKRRNKVSKLATVKIVTLTVVALIDLVLMMQIPVQVQILDLTVSLKSPMNEGWPKIKRVVLKCDTLDVVIVVVRVIWTRS